MINSVKFVIFRLTLMSCVLCRYYQWTFNCMTGGLLVRIYLIGIVVMHSIIILVVMILVNRSAQGAIYDTKARRFVPQLLVTKYDIYIYYKWLPKLIFLFHIIDLLYTLYFIGLCYFYQKLD